MGFRPADEAFRGGWLIAVDAGGEVDPALGRLAGGDHENLVAARLRKGGELQSGGARHLTPALDQALIVVATEKVRRHKIIIHILCEKDTVFVSGWRDESGVREDRKRSKIARGAADPPSFARDALIFRGFRLNRFFLNECAD